MLWPRATWTGFQQSTNGAAMARAASATASSIVAAFGGLLFGYDTAVISGAVHAIDANFIDPLSLSGTLHDTLSGLTISSALLGCIFGGILAGPVSTRLGRRGGLQLAACLFLISALGSAVPEIGLGPIGGMGPGALLPFNLYRITGGIGVGLASMLSPLYIAEIAPRAARGRLVSYNQMAIVLGILFVYFVNWAIAIQGDSQWVLSIGWRFMLASEAVPALVFLLFLFLVPDSPRWLVMKGRRDEALTILTRFSGEAEARQSLAEIEASFAAPSTRLFAFGAGVVLIGVALSIFQQAVGINAVLYYAPLMFENMGAATDSALLQTVLVGAVNMAGTLIAIFTVDRLGRRPLMIGGAAMMAVAMIALGLLFYWRLLGSGALIAILLFIAGFAMSWGPVTWVLLSELFPNSIKGKAMSLAVAVQWIANLAVSWSYKIIDGSALLNEYFHHGLAYWFYAAMSLCAAVFVAAYVPETKQRSLEAIEAYWPRRAKSTTIVARKTDQ